MHGVNEYDIIPIQGSEELLYKNPLPNSPSSPEAAVISTGEGIPSARTAIVSPVSNIFMLHNIGGWVQVKSSRIAPMFEFGKLKWER